MAEEKFSGFPKKTLEFLRELAANNDKTWFDSHRENFEKYYLDPSRRFVEAMGGKLKTLAPDIKADPRVNQSLFRINRDTRFSPDKTPYKKHLAVWFWEGTGKRMDCSGYYFHLQPERMVLGAGIYMFPKNMIESYRESVADSKLGAALARAVAKMEKAGISVGGQHYKRVPRGYDPDHKYEGLLRHNGLYTGLEMKPPQEIHTPKLVDLCYERFKIMKPVHQWLLELTRRAE